MLKYALTFDMRLCLRWVRPLADHTLLVLVRKTLIGKGLGKATLSLP